jgi:hypothetical protein
MKLHIIFALALTALIPMTSQAADADTAAAEDSTTLQLGTVSVVGNQKIVETLRAIKTALKTPFSDDPAHAHDVVCRIEKGLGEQHEYLDCATNRDYSRRRDATQTAIAIGTLGAGGTDLLRSFLAAQPMHKLRVPVQGGALQAVLQQIPDAPAQADETMKRGAVPAAATRATPAAATTSPDTWRE